ncbi:DNA cytosine methyltransferase [Acinetobacter baumannii]|uniref:DNA cytosine methyltransferase n=1 Tax=Acinetobacter calcoaceticus/baumannii complex TaxID=909768 RepID=UPI00158072E4|nr:MULTISPECIES: DNA cytosine methyltransferase [Acinetobacter calcoaceticus/baumannii complex]ELT4634182.1 DNA cytosine methyltransferase [Acinetobacter baumannii]MBJ8432863.1 DNA cytosine methyltransferase [Acinetobacter pittii]MDA4916940.1 DNA cytosine methyltransferase [Acinetobacter baumannii]MDC5395626.1 DNA cytosine methyltransferase [Acinetobacter baumannii]MDI7709133.1 DNA cytosine methyltransferase [Acinetobacter baumannii]
MNELALFSGAGGGVLASYLLGWRTVCAVERDAYAAQVLAQRQNDGILEAFPIWSDITSFEGKPWRGIVDVISGGFPCQDISSAGKGAGIEGERSGLWSEMARIIGEVRPSYVFVENSPMLVSRGLTRVISDLAKMGYDAQWARFSASNFGAPHIRDRIWIVAHSQSIRCETKNVSSRFPQKFARIGNCSQYVANSQSIRLEQAREGKSSSEKWLTGCCHELSDTNCERCKQVEQRVFSRTQSEGSSDPSQYSSFTRGWEWWAIEPELGRVADGVANRVDRLKAIGNGQVSIVAKCAFEFLGEDL